MDDFLIPPLSLRQRPSLNQFFCTSRLRIDTWNGLKEHVRQLSAETQVREDVSQLHSTVSDDFALLEPIERYWAFPGNDVFRTLIEAFKLKRWSFLDRLVTVIARLISTDHYRNRDWMGIWRHYVQLGRDLPDLEQLGTTFLQKETRPYFEILVVDSLAVETEDQLRHLHLEFRRPDDNFVYNVVVVTSFEDAVIATLLNYNIQACVVRYTFPFDSQNSLSVLTNYLALSGYRQAELRSLPAIDRSGALGRTLRAIRPELDLYLLSEATVEKVATELHRDFGRCYFGSEDYPEMHLTILKGIEQRFDTPFFNALKKYAQQPTGVFHAMPISRGKSISKSHWIRDYGEFYGDRIFLSETSATTGGLDSMLQPSGSIKHAQTLAARAFGADWTYFVSNGTSTANKIVLQAVTKPGDVVLLSNDCHISHHFAAVLADVRPVYLNAYPLERHSIFGGVPLRNIKRHLLEFRQAGKLDRVRALLITNLTFDGIAYDAERFMVECLAIKPDLVFLWDEAWFAYGYFTPVTRLRSAMHVANRLKIRFASGKYRAEYQAWRKEFNAKPAQGFNSWLDSLLLPDPDLVKVRVYSMQSTHKTLTALRQASMIHVNDVEFARDVAIPMRDAYLTHTSTSPNYQILASLDIGRRQMEFEGYELVQKAFELSMILRDRIEADELLSRYFRALGPVDLIPPEFRASGRDRFRDAAEGWKSTEESWRGDEFALDPTRVTLDISRTGMDGNAFKRLLMDRFDVQVNKTSRNTVLVIIHIGSTRGMITYLLERLAQIARESERAKAEFSPAARGAEERRVDRLTTQHPPLPGFSCFHRKFRERDASTPEGHLRAAFYQSQVAGAIEFIYPTNDLAVELENGRELVSAGFITPYPPGYPVLVPGQIINPSVVRFLLATHPEETHGFDPSMGLPVFTVKALEGNPG